MILKPGLLLLFAVMSPFAIDHDKFAGTWIGIGSDDPDGNHIYLAIDESSSGRFAFVAEGEEIFNFEFSSENVAEPEGYIELTKQFENWGAKILMSGWMSDEDGGAGLLTGYLFMYQLDGDEGKLFNSFPLQMWAYGGSVPSGMANAEAMTRIAQRYRSSPTND